MKYKRSSVNSKVRLTSNDICLYFLVLICIFKTYVLLSFRQMIERKENVRKEDDIYSGRVLTRIRCYRLTNIVLTSVGYRVVYAILTNFLAVLRMKIREVVSYIYSLSIITWNTCYMQRSEQWQVAYKIMRRSSMSFERHTCSYQWQKNMGVQYTFISLLSLSMFRSDVIYI